MQPVQDIKALVMYRDMRERLWACTLDRRRKSYDGRKLDPERDFQRIWSDFYVQDLSALRRTSSEVTITRG